MKFEKIFLSIELLQGSHWKVSVRKTVSGLVVLVMVTSSWVGATQLLKSSYIRPLPGLNVSGLKTKSCDNQPVSYNMK